MSESTKKKVGSKIFHLENKLKSGKGKHKYYTGLPQLLRFNKVSVSLRTLRSHDFDSGPYETFEHKIFRGNLVDKTVPHPKQNPIL